MADSFEPAKPGLAFAVYGTGYGACAFDRSDAGWLDHRQLTVGTGFFISTYQWGFSLFFLTSRTVQTFLLQSPTARNLFMLDYVGVALLVVAMGALQIGLEGEENDWFGSNSFARAGAAFAISFAALMVWEWYKKDPPIDLKLFKYKNFAACFLMLLTGGFLDDDDGTAAAVFAADAGYTAH